MKRLLFSQSQDKTRLYTNEVFCVNDVYVGEVLLADSGIYWNVKNSLDQVVDKGTATTVAYAQQKIKQSLIELGAKFLPEIRKYKV